MIRKLAGLAAALLIFYGAAWLAAAFWLEREAARFLAARAADGYVFAHGEARFAGFPTTVALEIPGLSAEAPAAAGAWRWQADRVRVGFRPLAPTTPVIDLAGAHRLSGFPGLPPQGVSLEVGQGEARLGLPGRAALESIHLAVGDTALTPIGGDAPAFHLKDATLDAFLPNGRVSLAARELTMRDDIPALGKTIAALEITFDVTGSLPQGALRESLEQWRAGGGALEVRSLALSWPTAFARGSGTLALDAALQPMGAGTVTFGGFADILAALTHQGYLDKRTAETAAAVLGLMAKPSAGGDPELSLPLTVQNRRLMVGPVMLLELPTVAWSAEARVP